MSSLITLQSNPPCMPETKSRNDRTENHESKHSPKTCSISRQQRGSLVLIAFIVLSHNRRDDLQNSESEGSPELRSSVEHCARKCFRILREDICNDDQADGEKSTAVYGLQELSHEGVGPIWPRWLGCRHEERG